MRNFLKAVFFTVITIFTFVIGIPAKDQPKAQPVLTHADAAVIIAKYSGFFERYVAKDASLNTCVTFLNKTGIYFGLMEVLNGAEFTEQDFARVAGQMALVFAGEATLESGKVKLPNGIASWEEFCTMNDINYAEGYQGMLQRIGAPAGKRVE